METIADIAATKAKYFTMLDAMKGYHQCSIDVDSQLRTTFMGDSNTYVLLMLWSMAMTAGQSMKQSTMIRQRKSKS